VEFGWRWKQDSKRRENQRRDRGLSREEDRRDERRGGDLERDEDGDRDREEEEEEDDDEERRL